MLRVEKLVPLSKVSEISMQNKALKKKIILCHGTFDLMHTGHIRYLQRARKEGDFLIVTVTADEFVNKGPGRPVFPQQLRAENLAALECVDLVAINYEATAISVIEKIKPDVYVKGIEYKNESADVTGNIAREREKVESYGGSIFYTDEITFSSSSLLNEHFGVFTPETKGYLEAFCRQYTISDLYKIIDSFGDMRVAVIGDAIVDQYHYVSPLGQTGKGNVLAVQHESEEQFAGGSIAVANHVSRFAKEVTLITGLGDFDSHEDFIMSKLEDNIEIVVEYFVGAPTVTKRRFVDGDLNKFFEVYFFKEEPELKSKGERIYKWLESNIEKYDLVIVADFGNGFINQAMVSALTSKSKFLAVNTQINSGNRGYHVINRYKRADFVSLNEPELRLAAHNRHDSLDSVCRHVAATVNAKYLSVTRGTKGVVMYEAREKLFNRVPALSSRVIDRIGAGDAYLSLSALSIAKGHSPEIASFVGSVAAAMDVQIVCNRKPIDSIELKKYVTTLMK
jgi:rfaE bifunctional protein nucleotidyltransferase chain/domain